MAARSTTGTRRRTPATKKDMAETLRLYLEEGLTQDQIAERQGLTQGGVSLRIKKALADRIHPLVDDWRTQEQARLEHERSEVKQIIRRQADDEMKLKGYDRLLRYSERLSKLLGADRPVQVEVSGSVETEAERAFKAELEENRALVAAAEARIKAGQ